MNTTAPIQLVPGSIEADWHRHSNGGGWVYKSATVADSSYVGPDAVVSGNVWVYGHAEVSGRAWVYGNAQVSGDAQVFGRAWVYEIGRAHV